MYLTSCIIGFCNFLQARGLLCEISRWHGAPLPGQSGGVEQLMNRVAGPITNPSQRGMGMVMVETWRTPRGLERYIQFFFFRFNRGFKANSKIYPGSICKRKTDVLCVIFLYFFFRQVGISKCTISGNPDFGMSRMSPEWIQGSFRVQRNSCPRNMTIFC